MMIKTEAAYDARRNIAGIAMRTPLIPLNDELFLKLESLQPIGSFKIRGAANAMVRAGNTAIAGGVLTASAGNMAQGVAYCARRMGVPATVVTPDTAPETKLRAIERLGGRIIKVPFETWWRTFEERSFPGVDATFIHAFADADVMAGNGTIGLEILEDFPDVDAIVIPWGGGGLACGIASVVKELRPATKIYAAECETGAPLTASLASGKPEIVDYRPSFVDGIASKTVFPEMLEMAKRLLDGTFVVTLKEAAAAMQLAAERGRVILEGAAACAVAAGLYRMNGDRMNGDRMNDDRMKSERIVAIVSGGNIDLPRFCEIVGQV
jgi:threonine dehydratase